MAYDDTNAFARILRGETPAQVVYADEHAYCFRDQDPQAPTHVVVIPRGSHATFEEFALSASPQEAQGFLQAIAKVTDILGLDEGYRLVVNSGKHGDQTVPHCHVHILGGGPLGALNQKPSPSVRAARSESPPSSEVSLFLLPMEDEPTAEQRDAFATSLGLEKYDANRVLGYPVPRVLMKGTPEDLRATAQELDAQKIPLGCLETDSILKHLQPWVVEWIEQDEDTLYMVGAEGRVPLHIDGKALVVRGRYTWFETGKWSSRGAVSTANLPRVSHESFAHLYLADKPRPYCFLESELRDYLFLGEEMSASNTTNFNLFVKNLAITPGVTLNTLLVKNPIQVTNAAEAFWAGLAVPHVSTPNIDTEVISRLIYFATF